MNNDDTLKRALRASAIVISIATAVTGCGGGGSDGATSPAIAANAAHTPVNNARIVSANHEVVPRHARLEGKTLEQWAVSFWQFILPLDGPFWPNPLYGCNGVINARPISAGPSGGNVWYWQTPILINNAAFPQQQVCDESANVIPANTYLFLGTLDTFSTNAGLPFSAPTAAAQKANAELWADRIQDLSVTIDNAPVTNIKAYQVATGQFTFMGAPVHSFFPPGNYTAVANGYYLIIKPLPAGPHTIHVSGAYTTAIGQGVVNNVDMTLLIMVGPQGCCSKPG
jgi:hypothetical protein